MTRIATGSRASRNRAALARGGLLPALLAATGWALAAMPAAAQSDVAKKAGAFIRIFGLGSEPPEVVERRLKGIVNCPDIVFEDGVSSLRSPAGADGGAVRYQISLGEMARECVADGARLSIRVGIEGQAILGPLGQPGTYSATIKIAVVRSSDTAILSDKSYKVGATIPPGGARADFNLLADAISVPNAGAHPDDDYVIVVSFSGAGGGDSATKKRPRRR